MPRYSRGVHDSGGVTFVRMHDLSRRDLLKTAASLAPLALRPRWPSVMAASAPPDVQQAPNALLELRARDVVERIRNGMPVGLELDAS